MRSRHFLVFVLIILRLKEPREKKLVGSCVRRTSFYVKTCLRELKDNGKVSSVSKQYAIKAYGCRGGKVQRFLDIDTRYRSKLT
jgi:hypothetical protein